MQRSRHHPRGRRRCGGPCAHGRQAAGGGGHPAPEGPLRAGLRHGLQARGHGAAVHEGRRLGRRALRPLRGHRRDLRVLRRRLGRHRLGAALHDRAGHRGRRRPRQRERHLVPLAALHGGRARTGPRPSGSRAATPTATARRTAPGSSPRCCSTCRQSRPWKRAGCGDRSGTTDGAAHRSVRAAGARPRLGLRALGRRGRRAAGRRRGRLLGARHARRAGARAAGARRGRARGRRAPAPRGGSAQRDRPLLPRACGGLRGHPLGPPARDEGLGRDRGHPADLRLGHPPGLRAALRRDGDRPDPARRRRDRLHHEHGRPRLLGRRRVELVRADAQPVRPRALRGRLLQRRRGSPLVRRHRPGRGLRPGRLDPRARLVVRRRRAQADALARALHRHRGHRRHLRPLRPAGADDGGHRAAPAGDGRPGPGRPAPVRRAQLRLRPRGRARRHQPQRPAHRRHHGGLLRGRGRRAGDVRRRARRGRSGSPASEPSCTSARCPSTSRPAASRSPASSRA